MSHVADVADKKESKCTASKQAQASQAGVRLTEGSRREEIGTSECDGHEREGW